MKPTRFWNTTGQLSIAIERRQAGFTMLEMMIVITVIGILVALSTGAYIASLNASNNKATQALITQLNGALKDRLESFYAKSDGLTPQIWHFQIADPSAPDMGIGTAYTIPASTTNQYRRAAVVARLEAMRGDFPQEFKDFLRMQRILPTGAWDTNAAFVGDGGLAQWESSPTAKVGSARSAIFQRYCSLLGYSPVPATVPNQPLSHDPMTESSECLFLMLTAVAADEGMTFSIDSVNARFIKDTDGDGLMEFVDSWGTPLRFYRWPTDYMAYLIEVQQTFPRTASGNMDSKRVLTDDNFFTTSKRKNFFELNGFYRLHPAYPAPVAPSTVPVITTDLSAFNGVNNSRVNDVSVYPLLPMIISAGPDKEFGLLDPKPGVYTPGAVRIDIRAGRVNADPSSESLDKVSDNITSLEITSGRN